METVTKKRIKGVPINTGVQHKAGVQEIEFFFLSVLLLHCKPRGRCAFPRPRPITTSQTNHFRAGLAPTSGEALLHPKADPSALTSFPGDARTPHLKVPGCSFMAAITKGPQWRFVQELRGRRQALGILEVLCSDNEVARRSFTQWCLEWCLRVFFFLTCRQKEAFLLAGWGSLSARPLCPGFLSLCFPRPGVGGREVGRRETGLQSVPRCRGRGSSLLSLPSAHPALCHFAFSTPSFVGRSKLALVSSPWNPTIRSL